MPPLTLNLAFMILSGDAGTGRSANGESGAIAAFNLCSAQETNQDLKECQCPLHSYVRFHAVHFNVCQIVTDPRTLMKHDARKDNWHQTRLPNSCSWIPTNSRSLFSVNLSIKDSTDNNNAKVSDKLANCVWGLRPKRLGQRMQDRCLWNINFDLSLICHRR